MLISCVSYGCLLFLWRSVIGAWALQEINALELANQRVRYIDCKHKPCNKLFILLCISNITKNIISLSIVIFHFFLAMFHDFAYYQCSLVHILWLRKSPLKPFDLPCESDVNTTYTTGLLDATPLAGGGLFPLNSARRGAVSFHPR